MASPGPMTGVDGEEGERGVGHLVAEFAGVLGVVAAEATTLLRSTGGRSRTLLRGTLVPESSKSANGMPLMMSRTSWSGWSPSTARRRRRSRRWRTWRCARVAWPLAELAGV